MCTVRIQDTHSDVLRQTCAAERETIIAWSDADSGVATVYTCQPSVMRRLALHPLASLSERFVDEHGRITGEEWRLPVECFIIRAGRRRPSPAQQAALAKARTAARTAKFVRNLLRPQRNPGVEIAREANAASGCPRPARLAAVAGGQP